MSKIKIEEVALESGVSNKVALEKAKEDKKKKNIYLYW